jgi:ribonuclease G
MSKEIYINISSHEKRVVILAEHRMQEFYVERPDYVNLVSNIYKGRVESVLPGMGAAFVNIGLEKNGFLYVADVVTGVASVAKVLNEEMPSADSHGRGRGRDNEKKAPLPAIGELLKKGDEVLVQVVKEPIGTKGARLTTHISIPGRFLVLMPFDDHIGISKRIEEREERDRIKKIIEELKLPKGMGLIVRTAARGISQKDFIHEARYILRLWHHIKARAARSRPPHLVHEEFDLVLRVTRDIFTNDFSKLEIDSKNDFRRISHFLRILAPQLRSKLKFHSDRMPIFEKYDIEKQIDKIYDRVVQLKSGGYLIFDQTESLVAIDVNSGKFVGKKNLEDTVYKTNIEAAEEIPRQLKLRDIGGIIIIDFIDMESHGHKRNIFNTLEKHLEDDKAKSNILNISSIGLVEMTRQRVRKSIEGKSYDRCPYCNGLGLVKSVPTVAIEFLRKLERAMVDSKSRDVRVHLNPEVARHIVSNNNNTIKPIERRFRKNIRVLEDPSLHIEGMKIEA